MLLRITITLLSTLTLAALASCNNQQRASGSDLNTRSHLTASQMNGVDDDLDLGEDWQVGRADSGRAAPQATGRSRSPQTTTSPSSPGWSIVLNTFSNEGHAQAAHTMLANLGSIAPELVAGSFTRTTDRGSMVFYGSYRDANDPRARADLDRIKSITFNGIPAFPRAFLTRVRPQVDAQANHPHSLLAVRKLHPNVHPLYTLQVAAWSDFDSGNLSREEIRRRSAAYTQELRAQGHEAYFHHDDRSRISVVTVGLFGSDDFDVQTGDESPTLRQLKRRFPAHLVNGEPLQELIDRHDPKQGTRVQEPRLVLVPRP